MTPEELAYHLRECQAPGHWCMVCDIAKVARTEALEEAARTVELGFGLEFEELTWDAASACHRMAVAIRALKSSS